jgi:hypothetical protein
MELLKRVKAIVLTPHSEWRVIAQAKREKGHASALLIRYVAILAVIPAMARFIGASLVGGYAPIPSGLVGALVAYLSGFAVVYLLALIIDMLAPRFGGRKNFAGALMLAVYSCTPVWLAGIFLLVPGLSFLFILGLYGVYLLYAGLPVLMLAPPEKVLPYAVVVAGCAVTATTLLGWIVAPLFSGPG